ncbi:AzlC family ABC transporter permease [Megalodesulfovibrio paquesii]
MASEFRRGVTAMLPVAASVGVYGSVLGVLAAQKGLGWLELLGMDLAIFAGSAQFVMVEMWNSTAAHGLPVIEMAVAALVINLRYLLVGASLAPLFRGEPLWRKLGIIHLVADENWAVTMAETRRGRGSTQFLLGGGVCLILIWTLGTLAGLLGGSFIEHPEAYALDFAFTAVFTALTVGLWRGKRDALPWLAAAVLAVLAERLLPGKWYIVIGGLGGAVAAMLQPDRTASDQTSSGHPRPAHSPEHSLEEPSHATLQ